MGQNLFSAARIIDVLIQDPFGSGDIFDDARAPVEELDQLRVDFVNFLAALLQKPPGILRTHFLILSARDRTNGSSPFGSFSICRTIALPTTTPSAIFATAAACSGVEIPNPAANGNFVAARIFSISGARSSDSDARSPVTPVLETRYTKPVEYCATSFNLRSVEVGAARKTVSRPAARMAAT